jgi:hypothetical protein
MQDYFKNKFFWQRNSSPANSLNLHLNPLNAKSRTNLVTAKSLQQEIEEINRQSFTGRWHKDKERCTDMEEAFHLVQLPWLLQQAVRVLNTLEIVDKKDEFFETNLIAGGIMDVKERYPWTGVKVEHARRDKRKGQHIGWITNNRDANDTDTSNPCIHVEWGEPHGGTGTDEFILSEDGDTLTQVSKMKMSKDGRETQYTTVFTRVKKH